jgi:2-polyprenyl-3-methyl-5-hydroxy-6-metoxy-1,4-benzoquinol methylase
VLDIILLLEVIEHLLNPDEAACNLGKMAKKGTYLVLSTPNPFWSVNRLKFLFLNIFPMFEKSDMDDNNHVFTAWPHVIERLLSTNGFRIIDQFTIGYKAKFPEFQFSINYQAKILVYFLRKLLERLTPTSKGMSYGVVAIKD